MCMQYKLSCVIYSYIEEAHLTHQQHILEQYSINKTAQRMQREEEELTNMTTTITPSSQDDDMIELSDLTIPTPSLTFPSTWSSDKSLSHSLTSSLVPNKTTYQSSLDKVVPSSPKTPPPPPVSSRIDLLTAVAAQRTMVLPSTNSSSTGNSKESSPPVVVLAWSPVKSGYQPKQTKLSSTRTATAHNIKTRY